MDVEFSLEVGVDENAGRYFDLSKKAKKKLEGAKEALQRTREELARLEKKQDQFMAQEEKKQALKDRKREWFEKFHWFKSSEGFLCIGGKDATSNEIVIKKHTDAGDVVFHTDMAGSPFFVVKDGQKAGEATLQEAAQAVGCYSRAWKMGHGTADVFWVKPDQVSKEAQSGEYMSKGSFMIRGKTTYIHPRLEYAIGLVEDQIIGGPVGAIRTQTKNLVIVHTGTQKKSVLAKKIKKKLQGGDLDEIIKFLPAGGGRV